MILSWFRRPRPPPRIGALAPADAPFVARIHAEAFARPWEAHEIERMLAERTTIADGAFSGSRSRPEGFALSRIVIDDAEILTIAVTRRAQGRGIGRALLAAHLARLSAAGVRTVFLEVEEGNAAAIRLYRVFGFVDAGRREGYYVKADGRKVAALVLRRALA
jgi:[ribosomal protein S18]-alanine N-acetyltransferase